VVSALQPGVELATVQRCTGWSVRASPTLHEIPPPTETELTILRDQVDPARRYLR
jgi:glutaconate CoA-transferase subunit B